MNYESWVASVADKAAGAFLTWEMYGKFLRPYADLGLQRKFIHGRILVAGGADGQIERSLLCTPESRFRQPYSEINSIWATDNSNILYGESRYAWPLAIGANLGIEKGMRIRHSVITFGWDFQDLLADSPDNTFDFITFVGIPNFIDQFDNDLVANIARTLTRRGVFMGSRGTGYHENFMNTREVAASCNEVTIVNAIELPDWANAMAPAYHNGAILLQKADS